MAKYIDAEAFQKFIENQDECADYTIYHFKEWLEQQPIVEATFVVRCWECKKHCESKGKHYCKFWRMYCPDDSNFFCKEGERKECAVK